MKRLIPLILLLSSLAHAAAPADLAATVKAQCDAYNLGTSPQAKPFSIPFADGTSVLVPVTAAPPPVVIVPPEPLPFNAVFVGPTRAVKDLKQARDGFSYLVDYSPTPYELPNVDVKKWFYLDASDHAHRPTLKLAGVWPLKRPDGPDCGSPTREGTIRGPGQITIKNVNITGGEDVIVCGTDPGARLLGENVLLDGGGFWRGSGAKDVQTNHVESSGRPHGYLFACFTNPLEHCVIDCTDTLPQQQGGVYVKGGKVVPRGTPGSQPQGETINRLMNTVYAEFIGAKTVPWLYDDKHIWKQEGIQCRPTSGTIKLIRCDFQLIDIGDMTWRIPAHVIKEVDIIDCNLGVEPHLTAGAKTVKYQNTFVKGVVRNTTVNR